MEAILEATKRDGRGKNEARRLRAAGQIPAVVYGARTGADAPVGTALAVDPKILMKILHSESGANSLISLKVDGAESKVMVREYQLDPIDHRLLHADFYQLALDRAMTVTVPVQLVGEAPGVKIQGGIVDFVTREIEVECLPTSIPEHVTVDISTLSLNQAIRVRELPENTSWKPVTDGDTMIVHIVMLKADEAAAAAPAAEPEVAKKGKTEKEGDAKKRKLIVGLGNPGTQYRDTRHNVGFLVVDEIARRHELTWGAAPSQVPESLIAKRFGQPPVLLVKPLTYMNRSGHAVAALVNYFDVDVADVLVVVDEVALPFGRLRARPRGSAGGHNGLRSLVEHLGTSDFPRLRLGVGRGDSRRDLAEHVLSSFEPDERRGLESFIGRAADAAEMFAVADIAQVMNMYNPDTTAPDAL